MPDANRPAAMNMETTCRIPRDELLGLLNTMTPHDQQRITAEMQAVQPPADFVIKFKEPGRKMLTPGRMFVIAASFAVSFGLGLVVALI
jgi:hypothetical protein